ncbi:MAG: ribosome silencing factor [Actinomycetes bacterium]
MTTSPSSTEPTRATDLEALALVRVAAQAASEKLAEETVALEVGELLSVVEYFIVTSGRNARQVASIVEIIEEATKRELGRGPIRIEGLREPSWVLMDYGDVVIHVFVNETRDFYDLEHLWSGAPRADLGDVEVHPRTPVPIPAD